MKATVLAGLLAVLLVGYIFFAAVSVGFLVDPNMSPEAKATIFVGLAVVTVMVLVSTIVAIAYAAHVTNKQRSDA